MSLETSTDQLVIDGVKAIRDELCQDRAELDVFLRAVGCDIHAVSFAVNLRSVIGMVDDQLNRAIGVYRRRWVPKMSTDAVQPAVATGASHISNAAERALRPYFKRQPENEQAVQDAFEHILRVLDVDYDRDKSVAPVGPTSFRPDFTVDSLELAIEIKLANEKHSARDIQRELAEDVAGYGTKWARLLVIVYDCGAIHDPVQMKRENEAHFGVTLIIVKH